MDMAFSSLLAGFVSGALTAIVTYLATRAKTRLDLNVEYDRDLRKSRLEAYRDLWAKLEPLARYTPERPITYRIVEESSHRMREWYFNVGGIYLSRESRRPYFKLKDAMQRIIDDDDLRESPEERLQSHVLRPLEEHGRALRGSLSDDIGTRNRPFV